MIPEDVMTSEAWLFVPHFARSVLTALSGKFRGINNGGLELTVSQAIDRGINKNELYAALHLLREVNLIKRTHRGRRTSGKGTPDKYAVTWAPVAEFPAYNIVSTSQPSNAWQHFKSQGKRIRNLAQAERHIGWKPEGRPVPPFGGEVLKGVPTGRDEETRSSPYR